MLLFSRLLTDCYETALGSLQAEDNKSVTFSSSVTIHHYAQLHPFQVGKSKIDLFLVDQRFRSQVISREYFMGSMLGTDHYLVYLRRLALHEMSKLEACQWIGDLDSSVAIIASSSTGSSLSPLEIDSGYVVAGC